MTNPGPPSGDPLAGPDASMGMPESGTHHATSRDLPLPGIVEDTDRFPLGGGRDAPRAYDPPVVEPTPAYDALAEETGLVDYDASYQDAAPGPLGKVTAFAAEKPAAFIAAALVAGWLVGKLFGSSDDD